MKELIAQLVEPCLLMQFCIFEDQIKKKIAVTNKVRLIEWFIRAGMLVMKWDDLFRSTCKGCQD